MRAAVFILWAATLHAAVVSRELRDGKLTLKLDDGTAEVEWISPVSFRFARSWVDGPQVLPKISHERIVPTLTETGETLTMRTRYITLDLDRANLNWRVQSGDTTVTRGSLAKTA